MTSISRLALGLPDPGTGPGCVMCLIFSWQDLYWLVAFLGTIPQKSLVILFITKISFLLLDITNKLFSFKIQKYTYLNNYSLSTHTREYMCYYVESGIRNWIVQNKKLTEKIKEGLYGRKKKDMYLLELVSLF